MTQENLCPIDLDTLKATKIEFDKCPSTRRPYWKKGFVPGFVAGFVAGHEAGREAGFADGVDLGLEIVEHERADSFNAGYEAAMSGLPPAVRRALISARRER